MQGACGYGLLDKNSYPFWSVAAFSLTNSFSQAGPAKACGQCFEIKCVDIGGPFAVSGLAPSSGARGSSLPSSISSEGDACITRVAGMLVNQGVAIQEY